ncbi:hypothetical protein AB4Y88_11890 [Paenarthrobacter sp. RAF9]
MLAAVALVLFWIPVLNVLGLFLGLAAIVLGVIALVSTSRSGSSYKGIAIAALAVGGFSFIGAVVTLSVYSASSNKSTSIAADPNGPAASPSVSPTASAAPSMTASPKTTPAASGSASRPHPLGTTAVVGNEYQVAINAVKLNATDEVLSNNMFNDPPEGQYVLVDIAVIYVGVEEGNPWVDLSPTFVGSDARQYDAGACGASLKNGAMNVPTLEPGGSASYQVCMDVPVGAVNEGKIFVQKSLSLNSKARTYWGIR